MSVVREAVERVALGSPLSHPDTVAPAMAAEEKQRARAARRDVLLRGRPRGTRRRHRQDDDGKQSERKNQPADHDQYRPEFRRPRGFPSSLQDFYGFRPASL